MSHGALIDRLQCRLGLDPESIGVTTLEHGIDEACASLGVADASALLAMVDRSERDWQRLVDLMVVPETWFFRVSEQFDDLLRHVRGELSGRRPLRILSLPCATGEEVYSIAATLAQAGLAQSSYRILGIDVSERAIAAARAARYRSSALRGRAVDPDWFHWQGEWLTPAPALLRSAQFRVGNILHPGVFAADERFDIIFCRNLLIYLDTDARRVALDRLLGVLEPGGLLLAGQAEVLSHLDQRLRPVPEYGPFTFMRGSDLTPASPAAAVPWRETTPTRAHPRAVPAARASDDRPARAASTRPDHEADSVDSLLSQARGCADAGHIDAARVACQTLLARAPESVDGWFLLGMIEAAAGALDAAEQAFVRTSFLDRHHRDALQHRAALAERSGRAQEAAQLRARLQRLSPGANG